MFFVLELGHSAEDACQLVHESLQQLRRQPVDLQRAHQVLPTSKSKTLWNGKNIQNPKLHFDPFTNINRGLYFDYDAYLSILRDL